MEPKVLADALVEAGIGYQGKYPLSRDGVGFYHEPDEGAGMCAELFITDWRVAGKVLESMNGEILIWLQKYSKMTDVWIVETEQQDADARNESLPRAIIEAWYEARRGNLPEKN